MKVKVNGAWVDVPAYKVKVGDVACLEGDITLASTQNFILVTHNLGKVAIFATIIIADEYEAATFVPYSASVYDNEFGGFGVGEVINNTDIMSKTGTAVPNKTGDIYAPQNTEAFVRFYSGQSGRRFLAGNYHYKIYYAV